MKILILAITTLLCVAGSGRAQGDAKNPKDAKQDTAPKLFLRHGYTADLRRYPQKTPKETLESIIKAIVDEQMEYFLAHLADPEYVDSKVVSYMKGRDPGAERGVRFGAAFSPISPTLAKQYGLPPECGLVLSNIRDKSPAGAAGLKDQDILVELGGKRVPDEPAKFARMLGDFKGDANVGALVIRDGKPRIIESLTLSDVETPNRVQAFNRFVLEITNLFFEDAGRIQDLRMFARAAEWKVEGDRAVGTLKQLGNRQVFLRLLEDRWFLENRQFKEK